MRRWHNRRIAVHDVIALFVLLLLLELFVQLATTTVAVDCTVAVVAVGRGKIVNRFQPKSRRGKSLINNGAVGRTRHAMVTYVGLG